MKIDISKPWQAAGLIITIIIFVFGAGGWATQVYFIVDQTRIDQVSGDAAIVKSIDRQTKSIDLLAETLVDHEARLRVNESRIRDLREKTKK